MNNDEIKDFNLDIEYNYKQMKESKNKVVTNLFIEYLVSKKYTEGISGSDKRIWVRIQTKLGDALDSEANTIKVNEIELDFIKKLFQDSTVVPVQDAIYFDKLEQAILAL